MELWQQKRVLILGRTYPSYSKKYRELACTAGMLEGSWEMVRLHPIPSRYLAEEHRFRAFQWIVAKIRKDDSDSRPESYRVDPNSIEPGQVIPSSNYSERRRYLEMSPHMIESVEALQKKQKENGTSLGIVRPRTILDCRIEKRPHSERKEWEDRDKLVRAQFLLFGDRPKPLDFPEVYFIVQWKCHDSDCSGHNMGLHEWGIHELYRRYKHEVDCHAKVVQKMKQMLDQGKYDVFMFLGNFRGRMYSFGLMGTYSAVRGDAQQGLFI